MATIGRILLVEDDPKDVELTMISLEEYNLGNEVVLASDGEEALDYSITAESSSGAVVKILRSSYSI